MKHHRLLLGILLSLTTVVAYGIQFPIAEDALKHVNPLYFTTIRYTVVSVLFLVLLAVLEGKQAMKLAGHGWKVWFFGSCGFAGYSFLVFGGQKMVGSAGAVVAAVIMALMPMLTVIVNWVYKQIRPMPFTLVSIAIALLGVILVITKGRVSALTTMSHSIVGDALILLGAVMWVIYTIGGSHFASWSPIRYTSLTTVMGTFTMIVLTGLATVLGWVHAPAVYELRNIGWDMAYMIVAAGLLALFCWNTGTKLLGATNSVLFMNLIPVTTMIVKLLEGERFGLPEILGAAMIITVLIANNVYQRKQAIPALRPIPTGS